MSIDLFLKRFAEQPAGEAVRTEIRAVLAAHHTVGPDDLGTYFVTLPHGIAVEFLAQELESDEPFEACAFRIRRRELDARVGELVLAIARAAQCVILPVMEPFTPILVDPQQAARVPRNMAHRIDELPLCITGAELAAVLTRAQIRTIGSPFETSPV
ncbi:MAG: hypothetical protein IPN34_00970 [Planctomycetes bacterium]|nr:hypothetical protein [Planctomycetota bacterium]